MPPLTKDFIFAMRRLASGVSVITCCDSDGLWHGMTATSVTSLTAEPASLLVCVNKSSRFFAAMHECTRFCVNVLGADQVDVSTAFGRPMPSEQRFQVGVWTVNEEGVPVLDAAQSSVTCQVDQVHEYATHMIFIGRVLACDASPTVSPLVYQNGSYSRTTATV